MPFGAAEPPQHSEQVENRGLHTEAQALNDLRGLSQPSRARTLWSKGQGNASPWLCTRLRSRRAMQEPPHALQKCRFVPSGYDKSSPLAGLAGQGALRAQPKSSATGACICLGHSLRADDVFPASYFNMDRKVGKRKITTAASSIYLRVCPEGQKPFLLTGRSALSTLSLSGAVPGTRPNFTHTRLCTTSKQLLQIKLLQKCTGGLLLH